MGTAVERDAAPAGRGAATNRNAIASFAPRKTLIVGVGGSGATVVTYIKANELQESGHLRPGLSLLAIDVMPEPPVVVSRAGSDRTAVTLEPMREYVPIGADLDPPHLSHVLRSLPTHNGNLKWLLDRQPGGRFAKSLGSGTEGERSYGLAAYLWSEAEIEQAVAASLSLLNDVRLPDGKGGWITNAPADVVIAGSDAGGVGSATALPMCGLIKRTMDRLGMSVNGSFFTYLVVGPEAFPAKDLRLANAYELLCDLAVAQVEGVTP